MPIAYDNMADSLERLRLFHPDKTYPDPKSETNNCQRFLHKHRDKENQKRARERS